MRKKTIYLIKAGCYNADFKFWFQTANDIQAFRWMINHAAYYDYSKVINAWIRIIGFTPFLSSCTAGIYFKNSSAGLVAALRADHFDEVKSYPLGIITPGQWYESRMFRVHNTITLEHTTPEGRVILHSHTFSNLSSMPLMVIPPALSGLFTLDRDLMVKVEER